MALNGRLDDADLGYVTGTGHRVRADLVPQTVALRAAFAFKFGRPLVITDGYRPYSGTYYAQVETFLRRYVRTWLPGRPSKTWNGVTYWQLPGTAMAATPGTSNHGWGTAIDFGSGVNVMGSREHDWMVANAPRFGWSWPSWWARKAGEAWHFEAVPVPASNYRAIPGVPTVPDLTTPDPLTEDDDMPYTPDEIKGLVKSAISEYDLETATGATDYGAKAQVNRRLAVRADLHHVLTGAAAGADPTFRQIRAALSTLTHAAPVEIVRDLDDEALEELARQVAALPDAINDELDRRAAARAQTAV